MDQLKLKEQVEIIREVFGYVNLFKNTTFVITLDSTLIGHPFFPLLIRDIVLLHQMGIRIVLVPGARTRIDEVLKTYQIRCRTVDGIRVSTAKAIPFIKMAAFDVSNKIMTMLAENNTNAIIGNWVRARGIGVRNGIDFQSSGIVEKLKTDIVKNVLEDGLIPIFPNIGWSAKGKPYNISSTELAFTIARELQAAKLFFVTDFGGIAAAGRTIPQGVYVSSDGTVSQLTVDQAARFIDSNTARAHDPQLELLTFAVQACKSGVDRVHIVNGGIEGMMLKEIFSNRGLGTMVYGNQHDHIRPMTYADIPEVLRIMTPLVQDDVLVPRTADDLERDLDDYAVYEVDGTVHACGALHRHTESQGEIAAVAVDEFYTSLGIGSKMISYLIDTARRAKLKQVFVLTTQTADWFVEAGFGQSDPSELPESKRRVYNKQRNSRVLTYALSRRRGKGPLAGE